MKLFVKKVILFSLFAFTLLFGLDAFLKYNQENLQLSPNIKLKETFRNQSIDADIMIYGSSVAEGALNPLIFEEELVNYSVYNSALSGRRIQDWISIYYEQNSYTKKRKIIILDIFPNSFNWIENLYHIHDFYPYLSNENVKKTLSNIDKKYEKLSTVPLYNLAFLNATYLINSYGSVKNKILNTPDIYNDEFKGHQRVDTANFSVNNDGFIPIKVSPKSIKLYEEIFTTSNCEIIIVGMPVVTEGKTIYKKIKNVYGMPDNWAKQHNNVHYINFLDSTRFCNNKSLFANYTHLNSKGADLLSKEIALFIKTLNIE